jgi:polyhydroxyalkanoate synthesis repressor PhaR
MTRLIKKYKNRRLYDMDKSQYITVDDLKQDVIDGVNFRVEDSTTGKDITNATLMQILVDMESGTTQLLSADMLRKLITLANHPLSQTLKTTLEQMLQVMQKQIEANPYLQDYQKVAEDWTKQMQQLSGHWQDIFKK